VYEKTPQVSTKLGRGRYAFAFPGDAAGKETFQGRGQPRPAGTAGNSEG